MKELFYFSTSDLMIQVDYNHSKHEIDYCSHRELSLAEREIVEQYLLMNVSVKVSQAHAPAILNYLGINGKLIKNLNQFHLKHTIRELKGKQKEADEAVKDLITQSMASYYFDKIGAFLLELRNSQGIEISQDVRERYRKQLDELIRAYNSYSPRKVSFNEVVPNELIECVR